MLNVQLEKKRNNLTWIKNLDLERTLRPFRNWTLMKIFMKVVYLITHACIKLENESF